MNPRARRLRPLACAGRLPLREFVDGTPALGAVPVAACRNAL